MSSKGSTAVGIIVAVLIIGAVATIGYYQVEVAPHLTTTTTTSTTQAVNCAATPSACVKVTIVNGANSCSPTSTPPCVSGSGDLYGYSPLTVTVVIGVNNTVVWTNNDTAFHTATSASGDPAPFASGCLDGVGAPCPSSAGVSSFQFTFTVPGTYTYHCDYHPFMIGKIVVLAGSGSTATSSST
jgi:plastocyanin